MGFTSKVSGVLAALALSASGAAAVTVTHTGKVFYIASSKATANASPSATQTVRDGDQFTLTYSFDEAAPVVVDRSYLGRSAFLYDLDNISISFSSGFSTTLSPHRMGIYASSNSLAGIEYLSFDLQPASASRFNELFVANDAVTGSGAAFSASLSEVASNIGSIPFKYGGYFADPNAIGASAADCGNTFCYVAFHKVSAGVIANGTTQPLPPVSPVPVPAPFVMLGMAMAGLVGFGRRAKA